MTVTLAAGRWRAVSLVKVRWHSLAEEADNLGMRKVAMPEKERQLCWQKEDSDGLPNEGSNAGTRQVVMLVKKT